ncbi:hypothetical protein [Lysobacter sp. CA196]|uniref:hypothetical protein n=1 Tax=Lysobacter sp. CA196 TaxID=3455606 RepID=UPI003F8D154E
MPRRYDIRNAIPQPHQEMQMDGQRVSEAIRSGDYATIWLNDGRTFEAFIENIDVDADKVYLVAIESGESLELSLAEVHGLAVDNEESAPETIDDQIKRIALGEYLMIWGQFPGAISQTAKQGKLKNVDFPNRCLTLHSTTYNHDVWVPIDKITYIDESRSGPGALGPAQSPDWYRRPDGDWYKGDRKYEG